MLPTSSTIIWSKVSPDRVTNSARVLGVIPRTTMSTACPSVCCELLAPPTFLFNSGQRYPDVTIIGRRSLSRSGCNRFCTRQPKASVASLVGWLFILCFLATLLNYSSSREKLLDNLMFIAPNAFSRSGIIGYFLGKIG